MANSIDLSTLPADFSAAVEAIRSQLPPELQQPQWGIICGSGLSTLGSSLLSSSPSLEIPYNAIPGFSQSSVQGHQNSLAFGIIEGPGRKKVPVVAALGRFHLYEGYSPAQCVFPTRVMRCLGAKAIVVTNASGGIHPSLKVGDILALHDHLSFPTLTALNPLIGPSFPLGPRFPPTSDAYDADLRLALFRQAHEMGLLDSKKGKEEQDVREGCYAYVTGPTYESRAECRALQALGADCVGMSTVPEIIAARQCGLRVLALSLVTNKVVVSPYFDAFAALFSKEGEGENDTAGASAAEKDKGEAASHEEVLEVGRAKAEVMRKLVEGVVASVQL